jgi:cytochrome c peroxidase
VVPPGWPAPRYDFAGNPVTPAGFALGRRLFYDPILSRDGSVACGSCHQQFAAFANLGHRVSHGIGGALGRRNAPGLFNLAWQPELMWDGSAHHLETQPIAPISNPLEMDAGVALAVDKLRRDPRYPALFASAFGSPGVDSQRLLRALAQFTGTLVSADSRYDRQMRGELAFTAQEQAGLALFRQRCAACHREPLFSDFSYRNNGLDAAPADAGRAVISGRAEDRGRFRVPSLRNVALTAPYMHDGRYDSLEQVLEHYSSGIQASPALDPLLAGTAPLSGPQRAALLAFLDTLTDEHFVHDPRFAETHD